MSGTGNGHGLPVVRWLQIGAAAAGMGLALAAAPGVASADAGAHSPSSASQSSAADKAATGRSARAGAARSVQKASAARRAGAVPASPRRPAAAPRSVAAVEPAVAQTAAAPTDSASAATVGRSLRIRPVNPTGSTVDGAAPAAAASTATPVAAASCTTCAMAPVAVAVQQFLDNTANWLAGFPANPITDLLQGAVWLVRRTLFPASVGVVTAPIRIPLQLVEVCLAGTDSSGNCTGATLQRLGIYATLGSGNPIPQFFEFDTGSAGFYAAYAPDNPAQSPWWGSSGVTTGGPVTKSFDSGTEYRGNSATTTVAFFASQTSTTPLLSTGKVEVGQMDHITEEKSGEKTTVWTSAGAVDGKPPIDATFYGDFGAAPSYEPNGIANLLNELTFARGVLPGYRIHVDAVTGEAWLQIGLSKADVQNPDAMYFAMSLDPAAPDSLTAPNSNTRYYSPQLYHSTINITVGPDNTPLITDAGVGITPDTGADTTLHNTNRSSQSSAITYAGITIPTDGDKKGFLESNLNFSLSGTTISGSPVNYFAFTTDTGIDGGRVDVQNGTSEKEIYYLNTGISLFLHNDVIYNMGGPSGGGTLGLLEHLIQGVSGG